MINVKIILQCFSIFKLYLMLDFVCPLTTVFTNYYHPEHMRSVKKCSVGTKTGAVGEVCSSVYQAAVL